MLIGVPYSIAWIGHKIFPILTNSEHKFVSVLRLLLTVMIWILICREKQLYIIVWHILKKGIVRTRDMYMYSFTKGVVLHSEWLINQNNN